MQYNICFLAAGSLLLVSENGNEQFKSKVNIEDESLKRCEKLAIATNLRNISDQSRYVFIRQLATRGDLSAFCVRRGKNHRRVLSLRDALVRILSWQESWTFDFSPLSLMRFWFKIVSMAIDLKTASSGVCRRAHLLANDKEETFASRDTQSFAS